MTNHPITPQLPVAEIGGVVASSAVEAEAIYREGPSAHEFPRTVSRLIEMRTHEYMAQPHASGVAARAEAAAATA